MHMMKKIIEKTGLLALGTGTFVYLYHLNQTKRNTVLAHTRNDAQQLDWDVCPPSDRIEGRARVPLRSSKAGPLVLQLQQVQVLFRHGARTPIHTAPRVSEVSYDPEFITRDHQASMFPYERISVVDGSHINWSDYSKTLEDNPLRGGAAPGALTTYGKEGMYMLGQRLRDCYMTRLDMNTFDANEISVMSSNIRRTVESAQAVMAGMFGKDHLIDYAVNCGPVQIKIADPCYNILIPDTTSCEVLKKNNHSAMVHPDYIPGFKEQREETEAHILKGKEELVEYVTMAQAKINNILQFYAGEGIRTRRLEMNEHRQHYQYDPLLQPLYDERSRAIVKVDRFWTNVLNRAPGIREYITKEDMKALVYLRDIRVEEFEGTLASGYRIHFYFDKNPYFYNTHICKEVFTRVNPLAPPSRQTPINWKPGRRLVPEPEPEPEEEEEEEVEEEEEDEPVIEKPKIRYPKPPSCKLPPTVEPEPERIVPDSLFCWISDPTEYEFDDVGPVFLGDVWKNPQSFSENEPSVHDPWDKKLNFVFGRDDYCARITHGYEFPPELRKFRQRVEDNATTILYYAMAGSTPEVRGVVTRLSAGPLIAEMVEQARKIVCGEKGKKLVLYSSHDSTMAALMEAMCIWDNKWPPFGADIRLELYKEVDGCPSDFYVRVIYLGKEQRLRGQGESFMHWSEFGQALRTYVIHQDDYVKICKSNILEKKAKEIVKHDKGEELKKDETPAGM